MNVHYPDMRIFTCMSCRIPLTALNGLNMVLVGLIYQEVLMFLVLSLSLLPLSCLDGVYITGR